MNNQQYTRTPARLLPTFALIRVLTGRIRLGPALAFLVAVVAVIAPSSAFASSDAKTHPAAFCRPSDLGKGTAVFNADGTVQNASTTETLEVVCPIIRDNTQSGNNDYWDVEVHVSDGSTVGVVKCWTSARAPHATEVGSDNDRTGTNATGDDVLNMTIDSQSVNGYAVLFCRLPPAEVVAIVSGLEFTTESKIIMYRSEEEVSGGSTTDSKAMTGTFAQLISNADLVNTGPFVEYSNNGAAQSVYPQVLESWSFPIVRDNHASLWDRVRLRLRLAGDNGVLCSMSAYMQDGTQMGDAGGIGAVQGPGNVTLTIDPILEDRTLTDGPYALLCLFSGGMSSLPMYDYREL